MLDASFALLCTSIFVTLIGMLIYLNWYEKPERTRFWMIVAAGIIACCAAAGSLATQLWPLWLQTERLLKFSSADKAAVIIKSCIILGCLMGLLLIRKERRAAKDKNLVPAPDKYA